MCYNASYNKLNYSNFGEQDVEYVTHLKFFTYLNTSD